MFYVKCVLKMLTLGHEHARVQTAREFLEFQNKKNSQKEKDFSFQEKKKFLDRIVTDCNSGFSLNSRVQMTIITDLSVIQKVQNHSLSSQNRDHSVFDSESSPASGIRASM